MVTKKEKTVKVQAIGPVTISNNGLSINYKFEANEIKEVPEIHLNVLLGTKRVIEVKEKNDK